ncbi:MAG: antitoxin MazE-like protein [Actinomycetales bacterium]
MAVQERVFKRRRRLRSQGLRPIRLWVPDVRSADFAIQARQQSLAVAQASSAEEDMRFVESVSAEWQD